MRLALISLTTCCLTAFAGTGHAQTRRDGPQQAEGTPQRQPYSFYPEKTEGGVSGNLPFNNQIRKHTDPLNANGAR